jgi:predicted PurR-regulated permease PerM
MIVIWHFVLSLVSLELFDFTPVNLIVSILLSLMAFVPLFRPWFGVLGVGILRMVIMRQYVVTLVFIGLYWLVSEKIYEIYYGRLQMHQIIVNFSVLFGIYSFGIAGIFYGPLIVILYTCVEKELISNYRGLIPDAEKKVSAEIPSDR